jgi:hypothetical protein
MTIKDVIVQCGYWFNKHGRMPRVQYTYEQDKLAGKVGRITTIRVKGRGGMYSGVGVTWPDDNYETWFWQDDPAQVKDRRRRYMSDLIFIEPS